MLKRFDHVNVRTANLQRMIAWYSDVLGMQPGPRPPFTFGGAWLYLGDQPLVHLVEVEEEPRAMEPRLEHFALRGEGLGGFLGDLAAKSVTYQVGIVPGFEIIQVNIWDPDGNHIHIDFGPEEKDALPAR